MYGSSIRVRGPFDEVVETTKKTLLAHGFGILGDMNLAAALHYRLGVERRPYRILGACWPEVANKAVNLDPEIGLLLPCNVVVREEDDESCVISFVDPLKVLAVAELPELEADAAVVAGKLAEVRQALEQQLHADT